MMKKRILICPIFSLLLVFLFCVGGSVEARETDCSQIVGTIFEQTQATGGLIVHVGCGTGQLTAALRAQEKSVVQGLDTDAGHVKEARQLIRSQGQYGPVTIDVFNGEHLPYTDNLVNLLVVSKRYGLTEYEMMRVLAPGGAAYFVDAKECIQKPWPREIDEWTHYLHGPDNNAVAHDTVVGPPRHMQWVAGPEWSRNHHKLCSISAIVTAQGRMFSIVDESPAANIRLPGQWSLVAQDAFNGIQLWKKPLSSWAWHEIRFRSGPPQIPRLLVASGERVYLPLGLNEPVSVLDAVSGETLQTYAQTGGAEEILYVDGILLVLKGAPVAEQAFKHPQFKKAFNFPNQKTILAIQAESGETLWEWSDPNENPLPETLASDGENVYAQVGAKVVCLDLKSGDPVWTSQEPAERVSRNKLTYGQHTLVVANDVVLFKIGGKLRALSAKDGKKLWECEAGGGFHSPLDVFVIDDLVWQGLHVSDSISPPPVHDFNEGRDVRTGEVKRENSIMVDLQTEGHHHRCYREKATVRYILAGKRGIEMMDLEGENHSRNNWVRGACQYGILPANGLIYAPPHACGCYMESKLRGFWALSAEKSEFERVPDSQRLVKGPGYGTIKNPHLPEEGAWPQYRHDSLRSGVAGTALSQTIGESWSTEIGGELTQPVIADGKVLVCAQDKDTVYALREANGDVLWSYTAGGRIDSPPTIYGGLVLFGSADGWVYCLRLDDGELNWRFLAAPVDQKTVAYNRIESLWPVHGSVLVLDGVAYCSAGRSSWLDSGIDFYGLDPKSGQILYYNHLADRHPQIQEGKARDKPEFTQRIDQNLTDYKTFLASDKSDAFSMAGGVVSDVLVSNGNDVFLHHLCFDKTLKQEEDLKPHLFSTSSLLDDAENHRSHWVLGTGDFSRVPVAYSWIVNRPGSRQPTIAVPTGVMLVYDEQSVWGVQRKGDSNGRYQIFEKENQPFSNKEESLPDFRQLPPEQVNQYKWKKDLPVRARAMVKSGEVLYLGVMPTDSGTDDPLAAYEGRKGGAILIVSADNGEKLAEFALASPIVWDGLAAANQKLFFSTYDGTVACYQ